MSAAVFFKVDCHITRPGDAVFVVGDHEELGAWNPAQAVPCITTPLLFPKWKAGVTLPLGQKVEFKLIVQRADGRSPDKVLWEKGENRVLLIPNDSDDTQVQVSVDCAWGHHQRPIKSSVSVYVSLAKKHHNIDVEVIDLGQYSQKHCHSCMFLTCSAALADRRLRGYADVELPGFLGSALESCGIFEQTSSVEELVAEHQRHRDSTLGRMADALRHAACELLLCNEAFFLPFFHPVHEVSGTVSDAPSETERYQRWVEKLRGDEEGDELVILALAQLCGIAVQPVQQSGYRVPLMDPTGAELYKGCITYWGNDDRHWVWLRNLNE